MKSKIISSFLGKFRNKSDFSETDTKQLISWYLRLGLMPYLRGTFFRFRFSKHLAPTFLGKQSSILYPKAITFGKYCKVGDYTKIIGLTETGIQIGEKVSIGNFALIQGSSSPSNPGKGMSIGSNTYIGPNSNIGIGGYIYIGEYCQIGSNFIAVSENHGITEDGFPTLDFVTRKGISIGRNCWIGHRVTVLDGVNIGDNSIIGAGAVVTKSFPENSVIAGVPAKLIERK